MHLLNSKMQQLLENNFQEISIGLCCVFRLGPYKIQNIDQGLTFPFVYTLYPLCWMYRLGQKNLLQYCI